MVKKAIDKKLFTRIFKYVLGFLGVAITLNGIALFFVSNLDIGLFLTLGLGISILVAVAGPEKLLNKIPKWFKVLYIILVCAATLLVSFLITYGCVDNVNYKEDAAIVLGAAVKGDEPTLTLKKRLDTAVEYHKRNPDAIIIVSGGKGSGEAITEAEAMQKYLIEKGVEKDKILKEDKAVSTHTNFLYSKEILDTRFGTEYTTAYITSEFHTLRAGLIAKENGFKQTTHLHANTNLSYLICGALRECLALGKFIIFKE